MPPRINLPPLTRGLMLVLLSLSALNVILRFEKWSNSATSGAFTRPSNYVSAPELAVPYLVMVPTTSLKFPWTALTAALVENNFISLGVSGVVIWFGGRYLERAWGSTEFAKFLLFTTMIPNVFSFAVYAVWHAVTSTPQHPTPIQGLLAVEAGFLIALKQLVPEHTVSLFSGMLRVRVKHFPAIFIVANMLSGPLLGTDTAFWLSLTGFLVSWIYLRFLRITKITSAATGEGTNMKGDASDTFAFVAFFPEAIHPFLAPVCNGIYNTLVQLRVCTPFSDEAIEAGNENVAARSNGGLPTHANDRGVGGVRRAEAERRRALALKALDRRLNAVAGRGLPTAAGVNSIVPIVSGDTPDLVVGAAEEEDADLRNAGEA